MDGGLNHYPHHIGDFVKDTLGFNQGAIGAYRLLMDAYYANEGAPALEDVYVIGRAATPAERKNVDKALTKFELRDGHYHHKRVEEELAAYRVRAETAKENGKKGGRKPGKNPSGIPRGTDGRTQSEPTTEPSEKLASSHKPVNPKPSEKQHHGDGDIPPLSERAAALLAVCATDGRIDLDVRGTLHVRQWAAEGVTDQELADAIAIAREPQRIPHPKILRTAYLATIIPDIRAGVIRLPSARNLESAIAGAKRLIAAEEESGASH